MVVWKRFCMIPGCRRSYTQWSKQNKRGRKPKVFQTYTPKVLELFRYRYPEVKFNKEVRVCDIHFTVHDFYPCYVPHSSKAEPPPEHLRCVKKRQLAMPTLYLDINEIITAQDKAEEIGEPDWWKLADSYDETLDLNNFLLKYNTVDVTYQNQAHDISAVSDSLILESLLTQAQEEAPTFFSIKSQTDVPGITCIKCPEIEEERKSVSLLLEVTCDEVLTDSESSNQDDVDNTKKLQMFRTLCTSPLILPNHWAMHHYIDDNFLIISKVTFSKDEGVVVERAVRITSSMNCPEIYFKGKNITGTNLIEVQHLNSVLDVEKLVEKVDLL